MIPNHLIWLACSLLIVQSKSLRSADNLGLIIAGYTEVSTALMFGLEWLLYRRNISERVYATEAHNQRKKEFRSAFGTLIFAFAALLSLIFDYAKDNDDVSVWMHVGVFFLFCLVSGAGFYM